MNEESSTAETNAQAAQKLQQALGLEIASGFIFEIPSGLKIRVVSEDDAYLSEPFQAGTKITPFTSAEARAPVKLGGDYWLVHQNDPDDQWPSNFHAHNKVRSETLDCHTGNIYNPRTRQFIRKYSRKKLAAFHAALPMRLRRREL